MREVEPSWFWVNKVFKCNVVIGQFFCEDDEFFYVQRACCWNAFLLLLFCGILCNGICYEDTQVLLKVLWVKMLHVIKKKWAFFINTIVDLNWKLLES